MLSKRRDTEIDRKVGHRIRLLRVQRGLSQEKLGEGLGLTFQQVQKYEKGANAVASSRIPKLCQLLKIEPNDLFDGFATFKRESFSVGTAALTFGMRFEKLGPKARLTAQQFLELVEHCSCNDG